MNEPLRAIIFCAVSSQDQVDGNDLKFSLDRQESDARVFCEAEGMQIIDVLVVKGQSRFGKNPYKLAQKHAKNGDFALQGLLDHFDNEDFDVLVVRDGTRLGRKTSMFSFMIESVIDIGARIFYTDGNQWVDQSNYQMVMAFDGYKTASDISTIKRNFRQGWENRVDNALTPTGRLQPSHRYEEIYINGKKEKRIVLNPDYELIFLHCAYLIQDFSVKWQQLGDALYERYGHTNPLTGNPFSYGTIHNWFHNPITYGHVALNHTQQNNKRGKLRGEWVYEQGHPIPDGVIINYDCVPAALPKDVEIVTVEAMKRRSQNAVGKKSKFSSRYRGLCLCQFCGRALVHNKGRYRCIANNNSQKIVKCFGKASVSEKDLDAVVRELIDYAMETGDLPSLSDDEQSTSTHAEMERIDFEITKLNGNINGLIPVLTGEPSTDKPIQDKLRDLRDKINGLERRKAEIKASQYNQDNAIRKQQMVFGKIKCMDIDAFFSLPNVEFNAMLHTFLQDVRFTIKDHEITGWMRQPKRIVAGNDWTNS